MSKLNIVWLFKILPQGQIYLLRGVFATVGGVLASVGDVLASVGVVWLSAGVLPKHPRIVWAKRFKICHKTQICDRIFLFNNTVKLFWSNSAFLWKNCQETILKPNQEWNLFTGIILSIFSCSDWPWESVNVQTQYLEKASEKFAKWKNFVFILQSRQGTRRHSLCRCLTVSSCHEVISLGFVCRLELWGCSRLWSCRKMHYVLWFGLRW